MNDQSPTVNYKTNQRISKLPSCSLHISDFKKLFKTLTDINQEAASLEISKLKKLPNQSDTEFDELKRKVNSAYKVLILIFGSKGEYIASDVESILDESRLPDRVSKIIFDNSIYFKSQFNNIDPQNLIRIEFDFSKPLVFDFLTSPSEPTSNNSFIQVIGKNETWVEGAYSKMMSSLEERSTKRAWLHQKNIYDIFLWFFILPASFWNLYKIELSFSASISKASNVFLVALYLYAFIVILWLFRMLFNYARWVFPYSELSIELKKGATRHRIFFITLSSGIALSLIKDLIVNFIRNVF